MDADTLGLENAAQMFAKAPTMGKKIQLWKSLRQIGNLKLGYFNGYHTELCDFLLRTGDEGAVFAANADYYTLQNTVSLFEKGASFKNIKNMVESGNSLSDTVSLVNQYGNAEDLVYLMSKGAKASDIYKIVSQGESISDLMNLAKIGVRVDKLTDIINKGYRLDDAYKLLKAAYKKDVWGPGTPQNQLQNFVEHFEEHKIEWTPSWSTKEQYGQGAVDLLKKTDRDGARYEVYLKSDGRKVVYDNVANEWAEGDPQGQLVTYFKPKNTNPITGAPDPYVPKQVVNGQMVRIYYA